MKLTLVFSSPARVLNDFGVRDGLHFRVWQKFVPPCLESIILVGVGGFVHNIAPVGRLALEQRNVLALLRQCGLIDISPPYDIRNPDTFHPHLETFLFLHIVQ